MKRSFLVRFVFGLFVLAIVAFGAATVNQAQTPTPKPPSQKETPEKKQEGQKNPPPQKKDKTAASSDEEKKEVSASPKPNQIEDANDTKTEINTPKPNSRGGAKTEDSFLASVTGILIWIAGAVAVVLLLGGIGYLVWRFVNGVNDRIGKLQLSVSGLSQSVQNLKTKNQELHNDLKNLAKQFQGQAGEISNLKHQEKSFQSQPPDYQKPSPVISMPSFAPEPEFPISVEEFLNKNGHQGVIAKFDYKTNLLIEDVSGDGALMIVRNDDVPGGLLYVVPRFGFFKAKDDFYTHLERYYDCQNPRGGTVWIKQPSVVESDGNGWAFREKGEIDIK